MKSIDEVLTESERLGKLDDESFFGFNFIFSDVRSRNRRETAALREAVAALEEYSYRGRDGGEDIPREIPDLLARITKILNGVEE